MGRQMGTLSNLVTITGATQASRVEALIHLWEKDAGSALPFKRAEAEMSLMGISMSRSTWHNLMDPNERVSNFKILIGLADYLGAPREYMTDEAAEDPQKIVDQIQVLRTMKVESVIDFATRKLGGFSPSDYDKLRGLLYPAARLG